MTDRYLPLRGDRLAEPERATLASPFGLPIWETVDLRKPKNAPLLAAILGHYQAVYGLDLGA